MEDARKTYRFNPYLAIYDSPAWHGTICDSRVWSWIVFNVNIGEETITLESGHPVAPGEVFTTYSEIAEEISWVEGRGVRTPSKSTISDTLDRLESMGLVNVLRTDGGTYIQVCEILKRFRHKWR